jgi:Glycosyl hydrolase catalytic core
MAAARARRAALSAALGFALLAGFPAGVAAGAAPAQVQYEVAPDASSPSGDGESESSEFGYAEERPAGVALDSLNDEEVILLLALVLILTAILIGFAWRRQRLAHPRRTFLLALVALAGTAFVAAVLPAGGVDRRAPRVPKVWYGMLPQLPEARPLAEYRTMKRGGVDSVRFAIPWDQVERAPGVFDFSLPDRIINRVARAGLEPVPVLNATPVFYGVNCTPADCFRSLPAQNRQQKAAWRRFVRAIVNRYGPRGRYWATHRGVPRRAVRIIQAWNEVNFSFFTEPRSPKLYAQLVKITNRAAGRGVKVILSGLFAHPIRRSQGPDATTFLHRFYQVRGIKQHFEGTALHPYADDAAELRPDIRAIRRVMRRHGDARTPFYLTEIGWGSATGGARNTTFEKGPRGQVRELTQAFNILRRMQRSARIARVYWFSWEDVEGSCNFCDSTGLWTVNAARPKAAWFRYRAFAKNRR